MLINSPNISGSLTVTGNSVITGSLTVLGGINGAITGSAATASYIEYSNVANKPTLVSGSSQVTYSGLTGIPSGIVSGSSQVTYSGLTGIPSGIVSGSAQVAAFGYATTGSNGFNGSQSITGSLTVTGQVVAQTLNVQQVTSSIVYSSGSNVFGNSLGNTQQFTGSLQVSGSSHYLLGSVGVGSTSPVKTLEVRGTFAISNGASSYWYMDRDDSDGRFKILTDADAERFNITTGGNVGIGTATPGYKLDIGGTASSTLGFTSTGATAYSEIYFNRNTSTTMAYIGVGVNSTVSANGDEFVIQNNLSTGNIVFRTNGGAGATERMRITSGGNIGIGTTSPTNLITLQKLGSVSTTPGIDFRGTLSLGGVYNDLDYNSGRIYGTFDSSVYASARVTIATPTGVGTFQDVLTVKDKNVGIGTISPDQKLVVSGTEAILSVVDTRSFAAGVGGALYLLGNYRSAGDVTVAGYIKGSKVNSTDGDYGFNLIFGTQTYTGGVSEKMRITSSGRVMIGGSSGTLDPVWQGMSVHGVDGTDKVIIGYLASATNGAVIAAHISGLDNWANLNYVATNHIFRSESQTERMRINTSGDLVIKGTVANISLLGDGVQMHFSRNNTNYIIANGGTSSTIRIISNTNGVELSNGATSWVAVSDENLKVMTEWKPFENSVEKILSLRAGTSRYKTDEEGTSRSFLIAQDVQEVLPEAVSEYEDGTLGLRYTEVIPLLIASIQELKAENDTLKSRIDTLEQA